MNQIQAAFFTGRLIAYFCFYMSIGFAILPDKFSGNVEYAILSAALLFLN